MSGKKYSTLQSLKKNVSMSKRHTQLLLRMGNCATKNEQTSNHFALLLSFLLLQYSTQKYAKTLENDYAKLPIYHCATVGLDTSSKL